jgi:hypothetical protein
MEDIISMHIMLCMYGFDKWDANVGFEAIYRIFFWKHFEQCCLLIGNAAMKEYPRGDGIHNCTNHIP